MQKFFDNIASINAFTHSLDYRQDVLECEHCLKSDQFVSHGFIYKQRSSLIREPVGKRLLCSNRYGRSGCGRTFQLYIASEFPSLQYGAAVIFVFITALLSQPTIHEAYLKATGQLDARHAWRWMNKLMQRLGEYRCFLKTPAQSLIKRFTSQVRRVQILLPTLAQLIACTGHCSQYQLINQKPFI